MSNEKFIVLLFCCALNKYNYFDVLTKIYVACKVCDYNFITLLFSITLKMYIFSIY